MTPYGNPKRLIMFMMTKEPQLNSRPETQLILDESQTTHVSKFKCSWK